MGRILKKFHGGAAPPKQKSVKQKIGSIFSSAGTVGKKFGSSIVKTVSSSLQRLKTHSHTLEPVQAPTPKIINTQQKINANTQKQRLQYYLGDGNKKKTKFNTQGANNKIKEFLQSKNSQFQSSEKLIPALIEKTDPAKIRALVEKLGADSEIGQGAIKQGQTLKDLAPILKKSKVAIEESEADYKLFPTDVNKKKLDTLKSLQEIIAAKYILKATSGTGGIQPEPAKRVLPVEPVATTPGRLTQLLANRKAKRQANIVVNAKFENLRQKADDAEKAKILATRPLPAVPAPATPATPVALPVSTRPVRPADTDQSQKYMNMLSKKHANSQENALFTANQKQQKGVYMTLENAQIANTQKANTQKPNTQETYITAEPAKPQDTGYMTVEDMRASAGKNPLPKDTGYINTAEAQKLNPKEATPLGKALGSLKNKEELRKTETANGGFISKKHSKRSKHIRSRSARKHRRRSKKNL